MRRLVQCAGSISTVAISRDCHQIVEILHEYHEMFLKITDCFHHRRRHRTVGSSEFASHRMYAVRQPLRDEPCAKFADMQ